MSETCGPVNPSAFILKYELLPPINRTADSRSFWSLSLKILKACIIEPVVVNTVSNFISSAEILTCASGLVIKDSFLQACKIISMDIEMKARFFIEIKNKTKSLKEKIAKRENS